MTQRLLALAVECAVLAMGAVLALAALRVVDAIGVSPGRVALAVVVLATFRQELKP